MASLYAFTKSGKGGGHLLEVQVCLLQTFHMEMLVLLPCYCWLLESVPAVSLGGENKSLSHNNNPLSKKTGLASSQTFMFL